MTDSDEPRLETERGVPPEQRWSFAADAPLLSMCLGRESGELFLADTSGGLYLLDRRGQVTTLTRGFQQLGAVAWSDSGNGGAAAVGERTLCLLDRSLRVVWSVELGDEVLDVAIDPYGNHLAAALANGNNLVFDRIKGRLCRFDTVRPLSYIRFVPSAALLVGVAEYGLVCCHELGGERLWNETTWSNVGDVCVSGSPRVVHIAGFNHGVQSFSIDEGTSRGTCLVEGTPNHVACSYTSHRLIVTTLERHLYWLDGYSELIWASRLADDVVAVQCDPLGSGFACGLQNGRVVWLDWGVPEREQ
jgi:hypothetical protein